MVVFLLLTSFLAYAQIPAAPLESAINEINDQRQANGYDIKELTVSDFRSWYQTHRTVSIPKVARVDMDRYFSRNQLPPGWTFEFQIIAEFQRILLTSPRDAYQWFTQATVVDGQDLSTWNHVHQINIRDSGVSIRENLVDAIVTPDEMLDLPASVPVTVTPIRLRHKDLGRGQYVDALKVELELRPDNVEAVVSYFGKIYGKARTRQKVMRLLGNRPLLKISIERLFEGWASAWTNRFPADKTEQDGETANDVCHGVARQFFATNLSNSNGLDRSTEASEWLLQSSYRLVPEGSSPTFGDYLHLPGAHSIRFILKDPGSKRWIGFSAWSSSTTPYRLFWVDRDYSPSSNGVAIDPNFPALFDIWRRK